MSLQTCPKISVVVPNYNYAGYLVQRIESILDQTYQDFELIILDDKSTDNSREIIEKYRNHPKVSQIVYNEVNTCSPCKQWRKGSELARGEYVWIAEADDFCTEDFLENAVEALEMNKDATIFFAGSLQNRHGSDNFNRVNYDRWAMPQFKLPKGEKFYVFDGQYYIEHYLVYNNSIYNASGTVFRREAANAEVWDYVMSFYSLGDWALWSRLAGKGKVVICREKLNRFRMHKSSATKKFQKEYANLVDALKIVKENSEALNERKRKILLMRLFKYARRTLGHGKRWGHFYQNLCRIYDESFLKDAKRAFYLNKLLLLTPWHIGFTEDRRRKPAKQK